MVSEAVPTRDDAERELGASRRRLGGGHLEGGMLAALPGVDRMVPALGVAGPRVRAVGTVGGVTAG